MTVDLAGAILWITTASLAVSTALRLRRAVDVGLLLPASWLLLIAIPAILPILRGLSPVFHVAFEGPPRDNLYVAIAVANVTLFLFHRIVDHPAFVRSTARFGNWIGARRVSGDGSERAARFWFAGLLVLAVGLALLHLALMPRIPIWDLAVGGADPRQLAIDRENSAKLLAAPALLKYAFTWNSRILLPVLLCAAVLFRWRAVAAFVLVFGLLYILSPLEKLPSMLFVLAPFVATAIRDRRRVWAPVLAVGLVVSLFPPWVITQSYPIANSTHQLLGVPVATGEPEVSDPLRPPGGFEPGATFNPRDALGTLTDLVLRRIGNGPIEVSYSWFQYFPTEHGGFLDGAGWAPANVLSGDRQSPANLVGLWAYYGRSGYDIASLSAYASFVADGWAEFGYAGVVLVCLALLGFLLLLELTRARVTSPFGIACYAPALLLTAVIPPQGGVPAMLFSLGVALAPVLWLGHILSERVLDRPSAPPRALPDAGVIATR